MKKPKDASMFAEELRNRRRSLNLTQVELGKRAKITGASISAYEVGLSFPSPEHAVALLKPLELSGEEGVDFLLSAANYDFETTQQALRALRPKKPGIKTSGTPANILGVSTLKLEIRTGDDQLLTAIQQLVKGLND